MHEKKCLENYTCNGEQFLVLKRGTADGRFSYLIIMTFTLLIQGGTCPETKLNTFETCNIFWGMNNCNIITYKFNVFFSFFSLLFLLWHIWHDDLRHYNNYQLSNQQQDSLCLFINPNLLFYFCFFPITLRLCSFFIYHSLPKKPPN